MNNRSHEQAIALAAVFQAATLVEQLARTGDIAGDASDPLIKSLFEQSPAHFNDVYGDPKLNLGIGLRQLQVVCKRDPRGLNPDVTRYALSLLHLERKLFKSPAMISQLGQGIDAASRQAQHFSPTHENTVAALAGLYKQTLSNLSFRIRVTGNPTYLQTNYTANRVRTELDRLDYYRRAAMPMDVPRHHKQESVRDYHESAHQWSPSQNTALHA